MKLRYLPLALALLAVTSADAATETYTYGNFKVTLYNSNDSFTVDGSTVKGTQDWSSVTSNYKSIIESAFTSWTSYFNFNSEQTINVYISWKSLSSGILAETWSNMQKASVSGASYNYGSSTELVLRDGVSVSGSSSESCDFYITFSTNYSFSYGDTAEVGKTDFQSVLIHEIMHNMGFNSSMTDKSGYTSGLYTAWDKLITDENGLHPGDAGFTYTPGATYTIGDDGLTVYNPSKWTEASSMSHIDGDSCSDALMQAYLGKNTLRRSLTRQEYALLQAMGWSLVFDDDIDNMYWVTDDGSIIKRNSDLLNKSIVYVNDNLVVSPASSSETISLSQLKGTDTSVTLSILTPDDGGTASVDFYNPSGKDSEYAGRVEANTASLSKTGAGKLTLSGNVTSSGTVSVKEGTLVLAGSSVNIANTSISSSLVWSGGSANLGKVTMDGGALVSKAASSTESSSSIVSTLLAEEDQDGEATTVANRAQSSSSLSASSLSGYGVLDLNGDTLTLTGSEDTAFVAGYSTSGTVAKTGTGTQILAGDGSSDYQLDVDGGVLALMNSDNTSVSYESVSVDNATLYLAPDDSNGSYTSLELAKSATFGANSTLGVEVDDVANAPTAFLTSTEQSTFQGGSNGATIYATASADTSGADSLNMTIASNATVSGGDLSVETDGVLADGFFYTNVKALQVGSDIVLTGTANTSNPYNVAASTTNTKAGANLLWNAHSDIASGTTLAALQEALGDAFADGDTASMSRMLSASVGSTVTGILAAANSSIANEQLRVRERATGIGFNDDRRSHFWIEGIGRFDTLDASGDEAGFEWNSWGGAVGADFKVSDNTVLGLSLTALTGDFSSSASDSADGDMDAEFLSLFARMQSGRWSHTVVLTGGIGSASYDRTVTYPGGSYRTNGDVDTTSFGALYQVAYDVPLNERKSAIFQPLATIAFHTASADDVTEKGAGNANLSVSGMDMSSVEVTLGGRVAGVLMQNATGRDVTGEFRLEVVQSMGDTQAEADVRFAELPGSLAQKVEGAELGSTGIRFGAGISVPVSQQGNVYGNAQAEFRSGSSVVNAAIGFQYSF